MKLKKLNQSGVAHIGLALFIVLVIAVMGYAGYTVLKSNGRGLTGAISGGTGSSVCGSGWTLQKELKEVNSRGSSTSHAAVRVFRAGTGSGTDWCVINTHNVGKSLKIYVSAKTSDDKQYDSDGPGPFSKYAGPLKIYNTKCVLVYGSFEYSGTYRTRYDKKATSVCAPAPITGTITIGTYNILGQRFEGYHQGDTDYTCYKKWSVRADRVLSNVFNSSNGVPDVIGFQEVNSSKPYTQYGDLTVKLGAKKYASSGDPENPIFWNSSKLKVISHSSKETLPAITRDGKKLEGKRIVWVRLQFKSGSAKGKYIDVFNIHLRSGAPASEFEDQIRDAVYFIKQKRNTAIPYFLTGDFNENSEYYQIANTKYGLPTAALRITSNTGKSALGSCKYNGPPDAVDQIWASSKAVIQSKTIVKDIGGNSKPNRASDHSLVKSTFKLSY